MVSNENGKLDLKWEMQIKFRTATVTVNFTSCVENRYSS